jgi:hypothetical protein
MKKILLLLFLPIFIFAELDVVKVNKALLGIKSKKILNFHNSNNKIKFNENLKFTSLNNADIILFSSDKHQSKMIIVNSYKKLILNKNSIGAIYLKKGRTQIVFVKERLASYGLTLNSKFKKYIIPEWQLSPKLRMYNLK